MKAAQAKKQLTPDALALSHKLINALAGYPLEMEAEWELLKTKLAMKQVTEQEIASFAQNIRTRLIRDVWTNCRLNNCIRRQNGQNCSNMPKSDAGRQ
ncbi:soluble lytic murein transglycosylase [Actinobacillus equuli]|nr:soluble lytic murein transglycosylase [Actinobacillus equuli]